MSLTTFIITHFSVEQEKAPALVELTDNKQTNKQANVFSGDLRHGEKKSR